MARQAGNQFITGRYNGLCFYEMQGQYYVRLASSLTGKRVKRDEKFKRTMALAGIFARASAIASRVYWRLPLSERGRAVRYALISNARKMLADGMDPVDVLKALLPDPRPASGGAVLRRSYRRRLWRKSRRDPLPCTQLMNEKRHLRTIAAGSLITIKLFRPFCLQEAANNAQSAKVYGQRVVEPARAP